MESLYSSTKAYIADEGPADQFETTSGVRQGGNESPNLFNLYLDYVLRVFKNRCQDVGNVKGLDISYLIPNEATNREQRRKTAARGMYHHIEAGYADDLVLNSWSSEDLQYMFNLLHNVFQEFGLKVNMSKTETMVFNWQEESDGAYPTSIININNVELRNTKSFKYLGVWITYDTLGIGSQEVQHRINCAKAAFSEHKKMLTNHRIKLSSRVRFMMGLVRSRLMYGCHTWRANVLEMRKITSTYNRFLRSMICNGFQRVNPPNSTSMLTDNNAEESESNGEVEDEENDVDWRYIINNERLYRMTHTTPITEFYQQQQANWIAHCIRRDNCDPCKILTFYSVKNKLRGRPHQSVIQRAINTSQLERGQFIHNCFIRLL